MKIADVDRIIDGPYGRVAARLAMIACAAILPVAGTFAWDWFASLGEQNDQAIQKIEAVGKELGGKIDNLNGQVQEGLRRTDRLESHIGEVEKLGQQYDKFQDQRLEDFNNRLNNRQGLNRPANPPGFLR